MEDSGTAVKASRTEGADLANTSAASPTNYVTFYQQCCRECNCRPNSFIVRLLESQPSTPLTTLNLGANYIGPKGFTAVLKLIAQWQTLESINLCGNGLDSSCIIPLCEVLLSHMGVSSLDLSNNPITLTGGKALMRLVETNRRIVHLSVVGTDIFETLSERLTMAADENYRNHFGHEPHLVPSRPMSQRPVFARL